MVKWILGIFLALLIVIGVGGYFFVKDYASDKAMNELSNQLSANEEEINKLLEDPEVRKYIESGETAPGNLLFTTKDDAVKLVSEKYSISDMVEMKDKISGGLDDQEKIEMYEAFQDKFSEEELLALKVVALKEIRRNEK